MLRLLRLALPSLLVAFAAAGVLGPVHSPDAFWHQTAGRWMLETERIPRSDPFRYTSVAEPWVDHEWGFQLLLGLADAAGGVGGWVALRCAVFALLAWMLWRLARRIVHHDRFLPGLALGLLVVLEGVQARAPVRPELLTLLAFAALLWLLERDRDPGRSRELWIAAPLLAVAWANVHPGVLAAGPIAFLHLLGRRLADRLPSRGRGSVADPPPWSRVFALPALLVLAIGVNPWGFEVLLLPLRIRSALAGLPATNPDWRPLWADPPWLLLASLALAATFAAVSYRRGVRPDLPSALVLVGSCGLAGVGLRFQGLAWIALWLFVVRLLAAATAEPGDVIEPRNETDDGPRRPALALVASGLVLLVAVLEVFAAGFRPVGVAPGRFPEAGVDALEEWDARLEEATGQGVGHLFHPAVFGGYLLYSLNPPRRIFLDTRNEVNPHLLRQLAAARSDARLWDDLVRHWDLDAALLRYEDRPRPVLGPPTEPGGDPQVVHHTTSALLFPSEDWALVHWDDVSMLFLRRRPDLPGRTALLEEHEYAYVQPEDVDATLRRAATDAAFRAGLVADLRRKLAKEPSCERARRLAEALRQMNGRPPAGVGP